MAKFYKKKSTWALIIIAIIIGGYFYTRPTQTPDYEYLTVEKTNLVQEVTVTGKVQATESVSLAFEKGGKVASVERSVNEGVDPNQILVTLDSSELNALRAQSLAGVQSAQAEVKSSNASLQNAQAQLKSAEAEKENTESLKIQAQASLESEQAKLNELLKGTRSEEIKLAATKINNAKKSLQDAQTELLNTQDKSQRDLEALIQSSNDLLLSSINNINKIFSQNLQDIIYPIRIPQSKTCQPQIIISNASNQIRTDCINILQEFENLETETTSSKDQAKTISQLQKQKEFLIKLQSFLNNLLDIISTSSSTLRNQGIAISNEELTSLKNLVTSSLTDINSISSQTSTKLENLSTQEITTKTAIDTAQRKVNDAQNILDSAEDEFNLKEAGATYEQIISQEALVKKAEANLISQEAKIRQASANIESQKAQIAQAQASQASAQSQVLRAQADLQNINAQLAKTILRSPIAGIVTKQDAKVGEIIAGNTPITSIISKSKFEIEANVPEADIAKIKLGDKAILTLDAYGDDEEFQATVAEIDPGETIIEGVTTYKITLAFDQQDDRIKPSMTANLSIKTAEKPNVIAILQRSIITQNGSKFVRVLKEENGKEKIEEVTVTTGLIGNNGQIEVTSGLKAGDQVITFINE